MEISNDEKTLTLDRVYEGLPYENDGDTSVQPYAIGAKYVDAPWNSKIPTTLVVLEKDPPIDLPDFTKHK